MTVGKHHWRPPSSSLWTLCLLRSPTPPFLYFYLLPEHSSLQCLCAPWCAVFHLSCTPSGKKAPPLLRAEDSHKSRWVIVELLKITHLTRAA